MPPLGTLAALLALATLCVAPPRARAQEQEQEQEQNVDALIGRGVTLREQGRDEEAVELFARAVAIEATPRALAQLGLAEQALGRWVDAEAHLSLALEAGGDRWIRSRRAVLLAALRVIRTHLGSLEVSSNRDATLRIDGREAAELPLHEPLRLPVGRVEIEVVAGGRTIRRTVEIREGMLAREAVEFPAGDRRPSDRDGPDAGDQGTRATAVIALVAAAVLTAGAIGTGIWWIDRQSELDHCRDTGCVNRGELESVRDTAAVVTVAGLALAGVGAVVGFLLLGGDGEPDGEGAAVACLPGHCRVSF